MIGFNRLGTLGRLGNQMFQYAALRGIAERIGVDWCIADHRSVVWDRRGNRLRIELFDAFTLPQLQHRQTLDNPTARCIAEKQFHYDAYLHNHCPDNVSLSGYFQSEKWFRHIRDDIKTDFSFKDNIRDAAQALIAARDKPVALHVRRTDYISNAINHPPLSLNYYRDALRRFADDRQILIFSDDPQWCGQQELFSAQRYSIARTDSSYVDLCAMSLCDDFIIANSSFSWWGAWLSDKPDKTVIAPAQWFGTEGQTKNNSTMDLIPDGWLKI